MESIYKNEDSFLCDWCWMTQENKGRAGKYIKSLPRVQRSERKIRNDLELMDREDGKESVKIMGAKDTCCCSFCGKPQHEVEKLITAMGKVYICNECVEIYTEILEEEIGLVDDEGGAYDGDSENGSYPRDSNDNRDGDSEWATGHTHGSVKIRRMTTMILLTSPAGSRRSTSA